MKEGLFSSPNQMTLFYQNDILHATLFDLVVQSKTIRDVMMTWEWHAIAAPELTMAGEP